MKDDVTSQPTGLSPALRAQEAAVALHEALSSLLWRYKQIVDNTNSEPTFGEDSYITVTERVLFEHRPLADWETSRTLPAAAIEAPGAEDVTPNPPEVS